MVVFVSGWVFHPDHGFSCGKFVVDRTSRIAPMNMMNVNRVSIIVGSLVD